MVVFCGMPVAFSREYHRLPPQLEGAVDGRPAGRYCFDCVPVGWSKGLLVDYLTTVTRELAPAAPSRSGTSPQATTRGWRDGTSLGCRLCPSARAAAQPCRRPTSPRAT